MPATLTIADAARRYGAIVLDRLHVWGRPVLSQEWTGFPEPSLKTGPATALDFPSTVGFLDRLDRKDRFWRVRDPKASFYDNCASRLARVGATNPAAGSGVNPWQGAPS